MRDDFGRGSCEEQQLTQVVSSEKPQARTRLANRPRRRRWEKFSSPLFTDAAVFSIVVLALVSLPKTSNARAADVSEMPAPDAKIVAIEVEGTADAADIDAARAVFGIDANDQFVPEAIRAGVQRVFITGPWADVQVFAEPHQDGVRLILVLIPDQVISDVDVTTTGVIPRDRVRGIPRVIAGDRFRMERVEQSRLILLDACRALGYPRATVVVETREVSPSEFAIAYHIVEGPPLRVTSLTVTGESPLQDGDIGGLVGIGRGAPFDRVALDEGLGRLVAHLVKRRHLRAKAAIEGFDVDAKEQGVDVRISVDAGPRYQLVYFGNEQIPSTNLTDKVPLRKIGALDDTAPARIASLVESVYQQEGFALVKARVDEVDAYPPYAAKSDRLVRVRIDEGPRARIGEIVIEGAREKDPAVLLEDVWVFVRGETPRPSLLQRLDEADLDDAISRRTGKRKVHPVEISDESFGLFPDFGLQKEPVYVASMFDAAGERIADTYRTDGYLAVDVKGPERIVMDEGRTLRVRYRIDEGPRTIIAGVRFTPTPTLPIERLLEAASFEPGAPANFYAIEETRVVLERVLREEGFAFAKVVESLDRRPDSDDVDVVYTLDEGPRVRVGQIAVRGHDVTQEFVIRDRLELREGDWFRASLVEQSRLRLLSTGLFSSVSVELSRASPGATVQDVIVRVRERSMFSVETGAGASIEDGPRAFLAGEVRNVFGLALGLRGRAQLNYPYLTYGFVYRDDDENHPNLRAARVIPQAPLLYHVEGQTLFSAELPRVFGVPFDSRLHLDAVGLREIRPAFTLLRGSVTLGLDAQPFNWWRSSTEIEGEISDFDCPQNVELGQSCGQGSLALTRQRDAGFIRQATYRLSSTVDFRDDPFRPRLGFLVSGTGDVAVGSGFLRTGLSTDEPERVDSDFVKLSGIASGYVPLADRFVIAVTMRGGNIIPVLSKNNYVPLYKRFYLGGTSSVRGFFPDQILPADDPRWPASQIDPTPLEDGTTPSLNSLGGNFFVNGRSELRIGLVGDLDLGLFVDGGQLLVDPTQFTLGGFAAGAGIGFRYNTPVGPFVIDVGWRVVDGARRLPPLASLERLNVHFAIGTF